MTKLELKKLWLKAHTLHQQRLKIKEWNLLIDKLTRHALFIIAVILGSFVLFRFL